MSDKTARNAIRIRGEWSRLWENEPATTDFARD